MVTVTPGSTAPEVSVTLPKISPFCTCPAMAAGAVRAGNADTHTQSHSHIASRDPCPILLVRETVKLSEEQRRKSRLRRTGA